MAGQIFIWMILFIRSYIDFLFGGLLFRQRTATDSDNIALNEASIEEPDTSVFETATRTPVTKSGSLCTVVVNARKVAMRKVATTRSFRLETQWTFWFLGLILVLVATTEPYTEKRMRSLSDDQYLFKAKHWTQATCAAYCKERLVGNGSCSSSVSAVPAHYRTNPHSYLSLLDLVIVMEMVICLIPAGLWKIVEGGLFERLLRGLRTLPKTSGDKSRMMAELICQNVKEPNAYGVKFFFCELVSLFITACQPFVIEYMLRGKFHKVQNIIVSIFIDPEESSIYWEPEIHTDGVTCNVDGTEPDNSVCLRCQIPSVVPVSDDLSTLYACFWCWYLVLIVISLPSVFISLFLAYFPNFRILFTAEFGKIMWSPEFRAVAKEADPGKWLIIANVFKEISRHDFLEFIKAIEMTGSEQFVTSV